LEATNPGISVDRVAVSRLSKVDFSNLPFGSIFSDHMLVADYKEGKWQAPQIVPYGPISLSPATSALHYGQCIFEGLKAFRLHDDRVALFRVRDNLLRFNRSAARIAMPDIPESHFIDGIAALVGVDREWVSKAKGASLYIRPMYFAVDEALVVRPSNTYRFVVFTCPVGQYFGESLRLIAEECFVRAFPGGTGATKVAGNYAGSLLAGRQAQEKGFHSVLWLDGQARKFVEESGMMNVFFVMNGVAITPPLTGSILAGVTRDSAITLLREMGVEVSERPIAMDELAGAYANKKLSEAFATGTAATVTPIASIRYRDLDIQLPVPDGPSLAGRVRGRLEAIRTGEAHDKYDWLMLL